MNLDMDVLRATLGDLVLQAIALQSANKALQAQQAKATTPAPTEPAPDTPK